MLSNYHDALSDIGIRISAIKGPLNADLETNYATRPLTATQFQGAVFPFSAVKRALLMAEEALVWAIASTGNHPWRVIMQQLTAGIAHRGQLPSLIGTLPIIGILGPFVDTSDGKQCTEQPIEVIERRVENAGTFFRRPTYYCKQHNGIIYHTRTQVKAYGCVYDRATQKAAIDSNGTILLPDVLEDAYMAGGLRFLTRDTEFAAQAVGFGAYFDSVTNMIMRGFTSIPPIATPAGSQKPSEG